MSPAQPAPTRQRLSRRQARTARRQAAAGSEATPLAHLRRRCVAGFSISSGLYLAVLASTAVRSSLLTLKQIIALEFGLGIIAMGCVVTAVFARILTHSTAYALSVWAMADGARNSGAARKSGPAGPAPASRPPALPEFSAIPIERGRQVRQERAHRAG